ncbi:hypothetical protein DESME_09385 [Desulfitobacterium metallireducens DSM 15288]|uniref:Uncharacterized protein n=1 Tax=Desulfitobacterium metallireducens DSM 15288 TaxID=871968 RepID=W0ECV6_9FIRM|nr:hypothetical protein DESME_09385 [Desulfitobacterium metallireducens DSM 15288]
MLIMFNGTCTILIDNAQFDNAFAEFSCVHILDKDVDHRATLAQLPKFINLYFNYIIQKLLKTK